MTEHDISFDLLQNAIDYLEGGAEAADHDTPRDWKYALLHLVSAIELLLKARLFQEHWSLVFADVDKADAQRFLQGDFVSVEWNQAVNRVRNISGVKLGKRELTKLDALRKYRNRVQHFAIAVNREQILPPIAYGYHFCLDFIEKELNETLSEDGRRCTMQVAQRLTSFNEFVTVRTRELETKLNDAYNRIDCPRCWQDAMELGNGDPRCLFCGFSASPESVADEISAEGGPEPCPECGGPCMRLIIGAGDQMEWVCLECGQQDDYDFCITCGALTNDDLSGQCRSCWEEQINRD